MAAPTAALFKNAASFRFLSSVIFISGIPTGNIGSILFCSRVLISIANIRGAACHLIRLAFGDPPSPQGEGKGKAVTIPADFI